MQVSAQGHSSLFSAANRLYVGGQPAVFGPVGTTSGFPVFTWSAVQGAASYQLRVDRTDVPQINVINVSGLTSTTYTRSSPLVAGTYRFWVRAVSTSGEVSIWSSVRVFSIASAESPSESDFPELLNQQSLSLLVGANPGDPTDDHRHSDSTQTRELSLHAEGPSGGANKRAAAFESDVSLHVLVLPQQRDFAQQPVQNVTQYAGMHGEEEAELLAIDLLMGYFSQGSDTEFLR